MRLLSDNQDIEYSDREDIEFVEQTKKVKLSHTHFMSLEGCGRWFGDYPTFWVARPKGHDHITVARYEGDLYLAKNTGKPFTTPILFHRYNDGRP